MIDDCNRAEQSGTKGMACLGLVTAPCMSMTSPALAVLAVTPRVDMLLTDIAMPDMNDRQLADRAGKPDGSGRRPALHSHKIEAPM